MQDTRWEVKSPFVRFFCSFCMSWYRHCRSPGYHVQVQNQRAIIAENNAKIEQPCINTVFIEKPFEESWWKKKQSIQSLQWKTTQSTKKISKIWKKNKEIVTTTKIRASCKKSPRPILPERLEDPSSEVKSLENQLFLVHSRSWYLHCFLQVYHMQMPYQSHIIEGVQKMKTFTNMGFIEKTFEVSRPQ